MNRAMSSAQSSFADLHSFAQRYTAAWCSHDPALGAAFYSPQGTLRINDGTPAIGREAITEAAAQFMRAFPDLVVQMDALRGAADEPEYHWTLTGTNTGPAGTGRRVRISGFEKWRMCTDGLIAYSQGSFDAADYERQIQGPD
jgi:hypothetical protein